jgi:carbon monoxide dehydrogenase subunit G
MPSATFTETVTIDAGPGEVWDRLQEPNIWQSVGPVQKVWDPTIEDGVLRDFQWSTNIGGKVYEGVGTALEHDRPDRYVLDLDAGEMAGKISTDLSASNPGGTDVVVSIELRSKGMLSSLFFPAIKKAVGSGFPDQVADMASQLTTD